MRKTYGLSHGLHLRYVHLRTVPFRRELGLETAGPLDMPQGCNKGQQKPAHEQGRHNHLVLVEGAFAGDKRLPEGIDEQARMKGPLLELDKPPVEPVYAERCLASLVVEPWKHPPLLHTEKEQTRDHPLQGTDGDFEHIQALEYDLGLFHWPIAQLILARQCHTN